MAKSLFTNVQLIVAWRKAAESEPKGTRCDVVRDIMTQIGLDSKNEKDFRRMYNNVTQRVKSLELRGANTDTPIKFAKLANNNEISKLAKLMTGGTESEISHTQEAETVS